MNIFKLCSPPTRFSFENRINNWNFIRLILAIVVIIGHFPPALFISNYIRTYFPFVSGVLAVEWFFTISGFLITSSMLANSDIDIYIKKRLLRIYPPIVIAALLSVVGAVLSDKSSEYIISIHHLLLFQDAMPIMARGINGPGGEVFFHSAFWTLVVEMQFYIILPILIILYKRKPGGVYFYYILLLILYVISISIKQQEFFAKATPIHLLSRQSFFAYSSYFIIGHLLRIHFDFIKKYFVYLFLFSLLLFINEYYIGTISHNSFLQPIYAGILATGIALLIPALKWKFSDISYGMYIYHIPIFGILYPLGINKVDSHQLKVLIAFVSCVIVSYLSYNLMEKRLIKR